MEMEARAAQRESNRPKSNQRGRKQASAPPGSDSEGIPALRVHTIANEDTSEDEDSDGPPTRKPNKVPPPKSAGNGRSPPKFYAVANGRDKVDGVFDDAEDAMEVVRGVEGARFKIVDSKPEGWDWIFKVHQELQAAKSPRLGREDLRGMPPPCSTSPPNTSN